MTVHGGRGHHLNGQVTIKMGRDTFGVFVVILVCMKNLLHMTFSLSLHFALDNTFISLSLSLPLLLSLSPSPSSSLPPPRPSIPPPPSIPPSLPPSTSHVISQCPPNPTRLTIQHHQSLEPTGRRLGCVLR